MSRKTRKLIWSAPLVAVLAIAGALAVFAALTPNAALAQTGAVPGQPGELMAMPFEAGIPEEQIELKWTAPSSGGPPTHYRIDISMNGGNTWTAMRSTVTGDRFLHTGLKAGQTFHYRIFAYNGQTIGPMSNVASTTTSAAVKPEKPVGLTAVVGADDSTPTAGVANTPGELTITLTWSAPPDPDGAPVLGYVIQYALHEAPGAWTQVKVVGDVETTTHEKLEAGRGYRYRIAAYNKTMADDKPDPSYMSDWSAPDSANTLHGDIPAVSTGVSFGVSPAEAKAFIFWIPPAIEPLGDPISHYVVEGRPTQDDAETPNTLDVAVAPWVTIKDNIDSSTTGGTSEQSVNSFEITLNDVRNSGGQATTTDGARTYASLFKTTVGWSYRIAAKNRAANRAGATLNYVEGNVAARNAAAPLAPVNLRVTPDSEQNEGRTALKLTWNTAKGVGVPAVIDATDGSVTTAAVPPQPATSYRIEYSDTGTGSGYDWKALGTVDSPAEVETQTFTDDIADVASVDRLTAGQTRQYRVFAVNTDTSWPSNPKSGTTRYPTKPSAPTNLGTAPGGHISINLSWTAPDIGDDDLDGSEEGDSVIKGYYIQYLPEAGTAWQYVKNDAGGNLIPPIKDSSPADGKDDNGRSVVFKSSGASRTFTDGKLAPNTSREYRVAAVNMVRTAEQASDWTTPEKGMTVPIPGPNAPGGLIAEAMGRNTIFLSWLAQAEVPEHAEVTGYPIQYRDGKTGDFMDLTTVMDLTEEAVHTIYTDTPVPAGTTRYYRIYAENAKGRSDQFGTVMATTDPAMEPGMPMSVTAMATSDTEITVTWETPADNGGADITGYMVESAYMMADGTMSDWMAVDPAHEGMEMMYMDTDLMPMTKYYYRVSATNSVGTGMASDGMASATTDTSNTAPTDGPNLTATVTAGEMTTVQSTISDPDTGDTLTWNTMANSTDATIATATVNATTGAVAITGVAAGMATITVEATDAAGATATQDIMVTVTTAMPIRPTITGEVTVLGNSISVLWDTASNQNAEQIKVALFDLDDNGDIFRLAMGYDGNVHTINPAVDNPGAHTFTNVPSGTYKVGVANYANGVHRSIVSGAITVPAP